MDLGAIHQPGLHALLHGAHEEHLKQIAAPASTGLGQHTVVGHLVLERVAQKPQPVQPLRQPPHQLALARDVFVEEHEHRA